MPSSGASVTTQIREPSLEHWTAMTFATSRQSPGRVVRRAAGFQPNRTRGLFYPSRNGRPPPSLCDNPSGPGSMRGLRGIGGRAGNLSRRRDLNRALSADNRDLSGQGFLRLMDKLRDHPHTGFGGMRRLFPDHPLWSDPFFGQARVTKRLPGKWSKPWLARTKEPNMASSSAPCPISPPRWLPRTSHRSNGIRSSRSGLGGWKRRCARWARHRPMDKTLGTCHLPLGGILVWAGSPSAFSHPRPRHLPSLRLSPALGSSRPSVDLSPGPFP